VETIGSKRSYALVVHADDDDDDRQAQCMRGIAGASRLQICYKVMQIRTKFNTS